jgi:hypothetical protein
MTFRGLSGSQFVLRMHPQKERVKCIKRLTLCSVVVLRRTCPAQYETRDFPVKVTRGVSQVQNVSCRGPVNVAPAPRERAFLMAKILHGAQSHGMTQCVVTLTDNVCVVKFDGDRHHH